ncbi:hypothetical protein D9758_005255 [Tetrapyrgos nigripes]|uniref:Cyanovirin-N domain-containing protein n=1 Tax=Tetrapyrgos nigripes TaxID=182062 RepID=A0A8H5GWS1_9AGAR|nr:hypothetical protein D9758_005255 [Tetrapyrgos nigripes]
MEKNISLDGSILKAELKQLAGNWVADKIDLSLHIKNDNGKLVPIDATTLKAPNPTPPPTPVPLSTSSIIDPPPAYHKESLTKFSAYRTYCSSQFKSQESRSSSYFMYSVASDKLRLVGSTLHAECLTLDGSYAVQTLDLAKYIGVVNGHLVWGCRDFHSACRSVKLEGYVLHAECHDEKKVVIKSSLDLSRYLHSYDGVLSVKVTVDSSELSKLFSEARWLKFRVVTEPDSSVVVGGSAFKSVFHSLAEATSAYVHTEMTQYLADTIGQDIKSLLIEKVRAEMTETVTASMTMALQKQLSEKIEVAFAATKKTVIESCDEVINVAVNKVSTQCTESVVLSVGEHVATQCNLAIASATQEVASTAITHFRENVEILMEQQMVVASTRRARTEAALLAVYKELGAEGVLGSLGDADHPSYVPSKTPLPGPGARHGQHTQQVFYLGTPIPSLHLQTSSLVTLVPGYNPNTDVEKIRKATKGWGTDEAAALHLAALGAAFKASVGENLVDILRSETSGWFKSTLQAIALGPLFYDVHLIDEALRGAGTDEQLLTELVTDRTLEDMRLLKEGYAYKHQKGGDVDALEREARGGLSGVVKTLFTISLSSHRAPENAPVDHALVEKDIKALYEAGQGKIGTDEIAFCDVLVNRSRAHLGVLCEAYEKKYQKLTKVIKSEFSGQLRDTLLYIIQGAKAPNDKSKDHKDKKNKDHKAPVIPETWGIIRDVKLLEKSMKGLGTNNKELVRRIIRLHWSPTRFRLIKDAYYHKYGKSLEDRVAGETSGDYKKLLVAVIRVTG